MTNTECIVAMAYCCKEVASADKHNPFLAAAKR